MTISNNISEEIINTLRHAGEVVREIEEKVSYSIDLKADKSPVTLADFSSDKIIRESLATLTPDIPLISEESDADRAVKQIFWLLDPIDGTKEFISGNGEYCISLALIANGRPVAAYIYSPVSKHLWTATLGSGAYLVYRGEKQKLATYG